MSLSPYKEQIKDLQDTNLDLERMISELKTTVYNVEAENKILREVGGEGSRFLGGDSKYSYTSSPAHFNIEDSHPRTGERSEHHQEGKYGNQGYSGQGYLG